MHSLKVYILNLSNCSLETNQTELSEKKINMEIFSEHLFKTISRTMLHCFKNQMKASSFCVELKLLKCYELLMTKNRVSDWNVQY